MPTFSEPLWRLGAGLARPARTPAWRSTLSPSAGSSWSHRAPGGLSGISVLQVASSIRAASSVTPIPDPPSERMEPPPPEKYMWLSTALEAALHKRSNQGMNLHGLSDDSLVEYCMSIYTPKFDAVLSYFEQQRDAAPTLPDWAHRRRRRALQALVTCRFHQLLTSVDSAADSYSPGDESNDERRRHDSNLLLRIFSLLRETADHFATSGVSEQTQAIFGFVSLEDQIFAADKLAAARRPALFPIFAALQDEIILYEGPSYRSRISSALAYCLCDGTRDRGGLRLGHRIVSILQRNREMAEGVVQVRLDVLAWLGHSASDETLLHLMLELYSLRLLLEMGSVQCVNESVTRIQDRFGALAVTKATVMKLTFDAIRRLAVLGDGQVKPQFRQLDLQLSHLLQCSIDATVEYLRECRKGGSTPLLGTTLSFDSFCNLSTYADGSVSAARLFLALRDHGLQPKMLIAPATYARMLYQLAVRGEGATAGLIFRLLGCTETDPVPNEQCLFDLPFPSVRLVVDALCRADLKPQLKEMWQKWTSGDAATSETKLLVSHTWSVYQIAKRYGLAGYYSASPDEAQGLDSFRQRSDRAFAQQVFEEYLDATREDPFDRTNGTLRVALYFRVGRNADAFRTLERLFAIRRRHEVPTGQDLVRVVNAMAEVNDSQIVVSYLNAVRNSRRSRSQKQKEDRAQEDSQDYNAPASLVGPFEAHGDVLLTVLKHCVDLGKRRLFKDVYAEAKFFFDESNREHGKADVSADFVHHIRLIAKAERPGRVHSKDQWKEIADYAVKAATEGKFEPRKNLLSWWTRAAAYGQSIDDAISQTKASGSQPAIAGSYDNVKAAVALFELSCLLHSSVNKVDLFLLIDRLTLAIARGRAEQEPMARAKSLAQWNTVVDGFVGAVRRMTLKRVSKTITDFSKTTSRLTGSDPSLKPPVSISKKSFEGLAGPASLDLTSSPGTDVNLVGGPDASFEQLLAFLDRSTPPPNIRHLTDEVFHRLMNLYLLCDDVQGASEIAEWMREEMAKARKWKSELAKRKEIVQSIIRERPSSELERLAPAVESDGEIGGVVSSRALAKPPSTSRSALLPASESQSRLPAISPEAVDTGPHSKLPTSQLYDLLGLPTSPTYRLSHASPHVYSKLRSLLGTDLSILNARIMPSWDFTSRYVRRTKKWWELDFGKPRVPSTVRLGSNLLDTSQGAGSRTLGAVLEPIDLGPAGEDASVDSKWLLDSGTIQAEAIGHPTSTLPKGSEAMLNVGEDSTDSRIPTSSSSTRARPKFTSDAKSRSSNFHQLRNVMDEVSHFGTDTSARRKGRRSQHYEVGGQDKSPSSREVPKTARKTATKTK